jgi:hypothetical protein
MLDAFTATLRARDPARGWFPAYRIGVATALPRQFRSLVMGQFARRMSAWSVFLR